MTCVMRDEGMLRKCRGAIVLKSAPTFAFSEIMYKNMSSKFDEISLMKIFSELENVFW